MDLIFKAFETQRRSKPVKSGGHGNSIPVSFMGPYPNVGATAKENDMTIDTNKARAAETSPHHVVLKMLIVSTFSTAAALALAAALN